MRESDSSLRLRSRILSGRGGIRLHLRSRGACLCRFIGLLVFFVFDFSIFLNLSFIIVEAIFIAACFAVRFGFLFYFILVLVIGIGFWRSSRLPLLGGGRALIFRFLLKLLLGEIFLIFASFASTFAFSLSAFVFFLFLTLVARERLELLFLFELLLPLTSGHVATETSLES
ncbi:hypothetical protein BDW66DRAFT_124641 [Aspergillus desertorum]